MANKNTLIKRRRARKSTRGLLVSVAIPRNMQQIVSHNTGADGKKFSVTQHVPIDTSRPVRFPGHNWMPEYRQPANFR